MRVRVSESLMGRRSFFNGGLTALAATLFGRSVTSHAQSAPSAYAAAAATERLVGAPIRGALSQCVSQVCERLWEIERPTLSSELSGVEATR